MSAIKRTLLPSAMFPVLLLACSPTSTEEVIDDQGDVEQVVIHGLVSSWQAGAVRGSRLNEQAYADVLQQNLRLAFRSMNADPERYSVLLARDEVGVEFTVELGERGPPFPDGVMADLEDSCELRADAGILDKRRWGKCMERLMGGGNGEGICLVAKTVRVTGDDGVYGTDDDIFVTTCEERATMF